MTLWSWVAAFLFASAVFVLLGSVGRPTGLGGPREAGRGPEGDGSAVDGSGVDGRGAGGSAVDGRALVGAANPVGRRAADRRGRLVARRSGSGGTTPGTATDAEVSSALALLALAYRSGLPTWDVLDAVAAGLDGPAARDLRQVAAALRWGAGEGEAWGAVGPAWAPAARAVAIAHHAGVPPGPMLLAAADDLRDAQLEQLELAAAKVGVRLVAPLGLVLLPAFCLTTVAPLVIALAGDVLRG